MKKRNTLSLLLFTIMLLGQNIVYSQTDESANILYQYTSVSYRSNSRHIIISKSDGEFEKIKLDKKKMEGRYDLTPLLKKITEMEKDGWELHTVTSWSVGSKITSYLLRKEKK